jgi:hypothetical protein
MSYSDKNSMNIRTITNPIVPSEQIKTGEVRTVKTEVSSEDRDPNGRREEKEPDKNPLNEEEFKRAEEYIMNLAGFKTNGLSLAIDTAGDYRVFLIKDQSGLVVRRIIEWELRSLWSDKDKKTGQLFDKSA